MFKQFSWIVWQLFVQYRQGNSVYRSSYVNFFFSILQENRQLNMLHVVQVIAKCWTWLNKDISRGRYIYSDRRRLSDFSNPFDDKSKILKLVC